MRVQICAYIEILRCRDLEQFFDKQTIGAWLSYIIRGVPLFISYCMQTAYAERPLQNFHLHMLSSLYSFRQNSALLHTSSLRKVQTGYGSCDATFYGIFSYSAPATQMCSKFSRMHMLYMYLPLFATQVYIRVCVYSSVEVVIQSEYE